MRDKKAEREFLKRINKSPDKDIVSIIGGKVDNLNKSTSIFVTRDGDIVDVQKASIKGRTHEDYIWGLIKASLDIDEEDISSESLFRDVQRFIEMRGWIRMGTGSNVVNGIYYALLVDWMEFTPTSFQYSAIEDFINLAYLERKDYVIIYFTPYDLDKSKTFYFRDYEPEDIMRIIRRYYSSGKIYEELEEVYPNKGESKKDFIARFMSSTKDEYPNVE